MDLRLSPWWPSLSKKRDLTWVALVGAAVALYWTRQRQVQLSPNFTLAELIKSETAAKQKPPLLNIPGPTSVENLNRLAMTVLEPLRELIGPFTIHSGFRTTALNNLLPQAVSNSRHLSGRGVDLSSNNYTAYEIVNIVKGGHIPYTQLIPYADGHVHIAI